MKNINMTNDRKQRCVPIIVYECDAIPVLVHSLWSMLKSEFCQLASLAVPQLLHALSLSHGADIFWKLVDKSFNNKDWKIRFEAGPMHLRLVLLFSCYLT